MEIKTFQLHFLYVFFSISYLIDGLKTELKLLTGQAEAGLLYLLCSFKRKETTTHFIIYGGNI